MVIDNLVSAVSLPMGPLELPLCDTDEAGIWQLLESVCDPEIPVLSLREIGVLRAVKAAAGGWQLWITPTYNGCPAMSQMNTDLLSAMQQAGKQAEVFTCLAKRYKPYPIGRQDDPCASCVSAVRKFGHHRNIAVRFYRMQSYVQMFGLR